MDKNKIKPDKKVGKNYNIVDYTGEEYGDELDKEAIKKDDTAFEIGQKNKLDKDKKQKNT